MCEVTCCMLLVMGCRSTKHQNSIADDAVKEQAALNQANSISQESKKKRYQKSNGKTNQKEVKNNFAKGIGRASHHKGNIPYSQSQLDFFEMLDKKIMEGKDYTEEEKRFSTGHVR